MHTDKDPAAWGPEPVRPRWQLALRFVGTLVCFPVVCALWLAAWAVLIALAPVAEVIAIAVERVEYDYERLTEGTLEGIQRLGSWFVTWPELRHEGDTEYYRARVDRCVAHWTAQASAPPREPKKSQPPDECTISRCVYRGVGAGYVTEVALAQGWELRSPDVRKEVRLRWSAASRVA